MVIQEKNPKAMFLVCMCIYMYVYTHMQDLVQYWSFPISNVAGLDTGLGTATRPGSAQPARLTGSTEKYFGLLVCS